MFSQGYFTKAEKSLLKAVFCQFEYFWKNHLLVSVAPADVLFYAWLTIVERDIS